ncbi:unnamed protein product (macronuclear) [Paramecium tetraurelia]|uniref:Kinase domain protein n=1 Tax=Paramecium tetraurelia TaxID=5888 RepID=A0BXZ2_PARTE|nr:uncharacterized protein GSPATT00033262001 [Paramecium tetraurelia]CAK63409.1 unnamed protein product [Paramecium tetraurelia]|eukprot:XP_001430807.1 hypothetical protein (macronuclear) [Paramecium tetraurelia strain d4-2]
MGHSLQMMSWQDISSLQKRQQRYILVDIFYNPNKEKIHFQNRGGLSSYLTIILKQVYLLGLMIPQQIPQINFVIGVTSNYLGFRAQNFKSQKIYGYNYFEFDICLLRVLYTEEKKFTKLVKLLHQVGKNLNKLISLRNIIHYGYVYEATFQHVSAMIDFSIK